MADDMFGLLYNNLSPERKLLTIVMNNMLDSLDSFIHNTAMDLNSRLQVQNGNTALHIACQKGHHGCIRRLLSAGVNPDKANDFGFSPLAMALRHNQVECAKLLIEHVSAFNNLDLIWMSEDTSGLPTWLIYHPPMIQLLIRASPTLSCLSDTKKKQLYEKFMRFSDGQDTLMLFLKTGNEMTQELKTMVWQQGGRQVASIMTDLRVDTTLQDFCRVVIRKNLRPNVFAGVAALGLPSKVRRYLRFEEESIM